MGVPQGARKGDAVHRSSVSCLVVLLSALIASLAALGQEDPQTVLAKLPSPSDFAGQRLVCLLRESSVQPGAPTTAGDAIRWVVRGHVEWWVLDAEEARFFREQGIPIAETSIGGRIIYARAILPTGGVVPGVVPVPLDRRTAEAMNDEGLAVPPSFVAFPPDTIDVGTVLEWEVEVDLRLADGLLWGTMHLGSALAIRGTVTVPEGQELQWTIVGDASVSARKAGKTYTFEGMGTPPPPHDGGTASGLAPRPAIVYSTVPSWSALVAAEREMLVDSSSDSLTLSGTAHGIVYGLETREAKIQALYAFVRDSIRYGFAVGWEMSWAASSNATLRHLMGDCKGKSALLVSMLRVVGIEAYPALASTTSRLRDLGELDWVIGPWQMDHVVVAVRGEGDGVWEILDPTCPDCASLLGHEIWILDGPADSLGTFYKVPWPPVDERTIACSVAMTVEQDGRVSVYGTMTVPENLMPDYVSYLDSETPGIDIPTQHWPEILGLDASLPDTKISAWSESDGEPTVVSFEYSDTTNRAGSDAMPVCSVRVRECPSHLPVDFPRSPYDSAREAPFETAPIVETCTATVEIPFSSRVQIPSDVHLAAPGVTFDATYVSDGTRVEVTRRFAITTDLVMPEDYAAFVRVTDLAAQEAEQPITWSE